MDEILRNPQRMYHSRGPATWLHACWNTINECARLHPGSADRNRRQARKAAPDALRAPAPAAGVWRTELPARPEFGPDGLTR